MLKHLRRKFKGFFFLFRMHWFTPGGLWMFAGHLAALSKWIAKKGKAPFNDFYSFSFDYGRRYKLYEYLVKAEQLEKDIDYLEFGVAGGKSFRWWAEAVKDENSRFYGFDTFTGLPEDWGPFKKGAMSNDNKPPEMNDGRCSFYQGLFQQTLLPFLQNFRSDPNRRRIIHMDADLYSSTWYVLSQIYPYLKKGDIILFDEFNVPMHEFKAFKEWSESFYIEYEVLAAVNNYYQIALKLK